MPISWIKNKKFKPNLVLEKINGTRSVSQDGRVSYSGLTVNIHMPVLASMLDFPPVAEKINKASLIWGALGASKDDLTKDSFIKSINNSLKKQLSAKIEEYTLLTSLSLAKDGVPRSFRINDSVIKFGSINKSNELNEHKRLIKAHKLHIPETPESYLPVRVLVKDKSPMAAGQQAIDRLDFFRGLMALRVNLAMQFGLGGTTSYEPINNVRCGGRHTLHKVDGSLATETFWFEPNFRAANIYKLNDGQLLFKKLRSDLGHIQRAKYKNSLIASLTRYARAFDEHDANVAFLKLWSALETLTTPDIADYDTMIKRCAFMFPDGEYHTQVLEHLRQYRNKSVHSGIEGEEGRTNCFLLQSYYRRAVRFYMAHHSSFETLSEANEFLNLPPDRTKLLKKIKTLRKAVRYVTPSQPSLPQDQ